MKLKSLFPKFRRKKQENNYTAKDNEIVRENPRKRNRIRRIINIGSPSSSTIRTHRTDSRCDDDSDGLYHPDYVPPPSRIFPPVPPSNLFDDSKDEAIVGDTSVFPDAGNPKQQPQEALDETSLHSEGAVIGQYPTSQVLETYNDSSNKKSAMHGVSSQLVWTKTALMDNHLSDDEDDDFIHSTEYAGESQKQQQQQETPDNGDADTRPVNSVTLSTLALDSTRASNVYYESDFDYFGLVTGVDVIDEKNRQVRFDSNDDVRSYNSGQYHASGADAPLMKEVNEVVDPHNAFGDYILPKHARWWSQAEPDPEYPLDEMDQDMKQLMLDDDVSALSHGTPPPAIYRNMESELKAQSTLLAAGTACGDGKMENMFFQVFHCNSNADSNGIKKTVSFTGTTITVRTQSGSSTNFRKKYQGLASDSTPPASASPESADEHLALTYESIPVYNA